MRLIRIFLVLMLLISPQASYAQGAMDALSLPAAGMMLAESPSLVPPLLRGMVVNVNDPLAFRFVVDSGKEGVTDDVLRKATEEQVKYFLTALTVPSEDLWVNLSPYEKDRMIPEALGKTDLGRDMLAQDYILKQLSSSMIHPDKDLGKEFWSRVYAEAQEKFGTTDIPVDTFNKIWIMPDEAVVFEEGTRGYVTKATLKVLLDEDYLALEKNRIQGVVSEGKPENDNESRVLTTQIMREVVLPAITKEVNEGANFAPLRQIYFSLVLAKWYKETVSNQLLEKVYVGKDQIIGVDLADKSVREGIYQRYVEAFKTGVFNFIKDETDGATGEAIPRKYFSGGLADFGQITIQKIKDRLMGLVKKGSVSVVDVDLSRDPVIDAQKIQGLLFKAEEKIELDGDEISEIKRFLAIKGFSSLESLVEKDPLAMLQGLSLLMEFDPEEYASVDQKEVWRAQRVLPLLDDHEMSHLAFPASIVETFDLKNSLEPAKWIAFKNSPLMKAKEKLERDNNNIRSLRREFFVEDKSDVAVFLLRKIHQHIDEANDFMKQFSAFMTTEFPERFLFLNVSLMTLRKTRLFRSKARILCFLICSRRKLYI